MEDNDLFFQVCVLFVLLLLFLDIHCLRYDFKHFMEDNKTVIEYHIKDVKELEPVRIMK